MALDMSAPQSREYAVTTARAQFSRPIESPHHLFSELPPSCSNAGARLIRTLEGSARQRVRPGAV